MIPGLAACGSNDNQSENATAAQNATTVAETAATAAPVERGELCGETRGPDGKLFVHKLGNATLDCGEAMRVAEAFGPKIASARPETVQGWKCTLPSTPGMLARCDSGAKAIGFFSSH